jgi:hypothetical protein
MMTARRSVLLGLILSVGLFALPVHAQVNIDVQIGQPPPVVVYSPPTMVLMPEPQMYVAVGVPYDIFFVSGRYYYFDDGDWFWGPGYGGPWTYVKVEKLPKALRKYRMRELREFREREYRVYQLQGPGSGRAYFIAKERYDDDDDDDDRKRGKRKERRR